MAKKQKTQKVVEPLIEKDFEEVETPVMETPKPKKVEPKKPSWEIKDRVYVLSNGKSPLSSSIKSADIYHFDEKLGHERELKYTKNQTTPFVDEMKGDQRLEHIIFRNGNLAVPKNKTVLQKMLSLYHPMRNILYAEHKPQAVAANQVETIELEIEALNAAINMDIDMAEAIMRVELGSKVSSMSSKELKRDLLLFAKMSPGLFLDLANDENVQLRNFAIQATEAGIIRLSDDQRYFTWASNGRKLMEVPFDENPYSAFAYFLKTDEGVEIYKSIDKKIN